MTMVNLRIEPGENGSIRGAKFYLDGNEIGHYVRNLKLEFSVDYPLAIATVEFLVMPDIPEELKVVLQDSTISDPLNVLGGDG
jgi:hypothetical protein